LTNAKSETVDHRYHSYRSKKISQGDFENDHQTEMRLLLLLLLLLLMMMMMMSMFDRQPEMTM